MGEASQLLGVSTDSTLELFLLFNSVMRVGHDDHMFLPGRFLYSMVYPLLSVTWFPVPSKASKSCKCILF
jgi:hypothetical protein